LNELLLRRTTVFDPVNALLHVHNTWNFWLISPMHSVAEPGVLCFIAVRGIFPQITETKYMGISGDWSCLQIAAT